jgi:ankyrin repeat protein
VIDPRLRHAVAGIAALLMMVPAAAQAGELIDALSSRDLGGARTLIVQGADVQEAAPDGATALHWAVYHQEPEIVRALLDAGADAIAANRLGVTPLELAIQNEGAAIADMLLTAGADAAATGSAGETMLMQAARTSSADMTRLLLQHGADAQARDEAFQQTALMIAVREGTAEAVALLIEAGSEADAASRTGETPAFRRPEDNAGSKGVGIVRGGWPPQGERAPTPGAKTPLLYAARDGRSEAARLLIEAGADIEKADADGVTPLLTAIVNGHMDVVRLLLDAGANVNARDWYGRTPLWAAVDYRNLDVPGATRDNGVDRDDVHDIIVRLLDSGVDPDVRTQEYPPDRRWVTSLGSLAWVDVTGQTPFFRAALAGDLTVMRLLLDRGADPNIATFSGTTPLMAAAGVNWVFNQTFDEGEAALLEAVKLTHTLGGDPAAVNAMGIGAIHGAANRGSESIVAYLAEQGVPLDVADNEGRTPMNWAEGVFLATNAPEPKPTVIALLTRLMNGS